MSHLAKIELQIKDLAALRLAASARGLELVEGAQSFKWYRGQGKCDHKLRVKGGSARGYEIGIVRDEVGGGYSLLWDDFDQELKGAAGAGAGLVRDESGGFSLLWDDFDHNLRDAAGGRDAGALKQEYGAAVATKYYESEGFTVHRTLSSDGKIVLTADK